MALVASVSLSLAAITGALSVLNPCGFRYCRHSCRSLSVPTTPGSLRLRQVSLRGLQTGLLVTAGFLGVFTLIGLPIILSVNVVARVIPWVGLVIGALLVVVGATALAGQGLDEQPIL